MNMTILYFFFRTGHLTLNLYSFKGLLCNNNGRNLSDGHNLFYIKKTWITKLINFISKKLMK